MNYIKYLFSITGLLVAVPLVAAPMDRTVFSTLEPHRSKTFELSLPKGKNSIQVRQSEDEVKPILTCTFSKDVKVLTQSSVKECLTNFALSSDETVSVTVLNESNNTIDIRVRQYLVKR